MNVLVWMFVGSVQIISRQDSQSKFQTFTLFSSCRIFLPTWRLHILVLKFAQNISTNIGILGKRRDLKLREAFSLLVFFNTITISWLNPSNRFRSQLFFRYRDVAKPGGHKMGDQKKGFHCKIIDNERVLSKVKAVFFNKDFLRFSLFPGYLCTSSVREEKATNVWNAKGPQLPFTVLQ